MDFQETRNQSISGAPTRKFLLKKQRPHLKKRTWQMKIQQKLGGNILPPPMLERKSPKFLMEIFPPPPKKKNSPKAPEKTKPPVYPFIIIPNPQPQPPQPQGESITKRGDSGMKHPNTNSRRPARPGNTIPEAVKVGWKNPHLSL